MQIYVFTAVLVLLSTLPAQSERDWIGGKNTTIKLQNDNIECERQQRKTIRRRM